MHIGLIVKVSKLCNLRCTYCCEGAELSERRRMALADIERMYAGIGDFLAASDNGPHKLTFYWHGGEPFAQPIPYWESILAAQTSAFAGLGRRLRVLNAVQSNLTVLTPRHLPLLAHFRLGFSFDVVNHLRVFANGRTSADRVVSTIDWLSRAGVPLAGIVVVSTATVNHPDEVAAFYLQRKLPFRFIQLDEGLEHLPAVHAARVTFTRFLDFARALYASREVRSAMSRGLRVDPLTLAAQTLAKAQRMRRPSISRNACAEREHLLEVNTDGEVYSTADYPYRNSYGNLFHQPLKTLLASPARQARIERSARRLGEVCEGCQLYRRSCDGAWVSHATEPQYQEFRQQGGCELSVIAGWMTERPPAMADTPLPASVENELSY